jgi:hypothetical protein
MRAAAVLAGVVALAACGGGDGGGLSVRSLTVGTCFDEPVNAEQITDVHPVPCTGAHRYEVYAVFALPLPAGEPYPGADNVDKAAVAGCGQQPGAPDGTLYDTFSLAPTEAGWNKGDRSVTCAASLRGGAISNGPLSAGPGSSATTLPPGAPTTT